MTQKKRNEALIGIGLFLVEVALLLVFFSFSWNSASVIAGVGSPNTTVLTLLKIGNVYPEVLNVSIDEDAGSITLIPNATKLVTCAGVLRDYNGENDMYKVNATLFGQTSSSIYDADDNNWHYSNTSCVINTSFGSFNGYNDDEYMALANCTFDVHYYAVPEPWECDLLVEDLVNWTANLSDSITMDQLLGIGLPDIIDYGTVNATYVSDENQTNVTNFGNVDINLSLEGFGAAQGDGYAMNCTTGNVQNISIEYEQYNLTNSNLGALTFSQMDANYTNLTSGSAEIKFFNLTARFNDTYNEAFKPSYWRIYVPIGVAGNCSGNIVFGATTADGT